MNDTYNDPTAFYLIKDTIVLVNNQQHSSHLIEFYSLKTGSCILQLAEKGSGPEDFVSCNCYSFSNLQSSFYIQDDNTHTFYSISIDETLKRKKLYINNKFRYNPEIHPYTTIFPINETCYLGYNMWHLDDSIYNNNVPAFKKYQVEKENLDHNNFTPDLQKYKYFVADVNGGNILMLPNKKICLLDMHKDKITFYNDSLSITKTIIGPDNFDIKYNEKATNIPMPFIVFKNDKNYSSYKSWTLTKNHIYIIYEGLNGKEFDPDNLLPVEIFKFDFEGNPICAYKLDRYVYHISIDSQDQYLYATTRKSYKEPAEFIKYKL